MGTAHVPTPPAFCLSSVASSGCQAREIGGEPLLPQAGWWPPLGTLEASFLSHRPPAFFLLSLPYKTTTHTLFPQPVTSLFARIL